MTQPVTPTVSPIQNVQDIRESFRNAEKEWWIRDEENDVIAGLITYGDTKYIFTLYDFDPYSHIIWMYVTVTPKMIKEILDGNIPLYMAFAAPDARIFVDHFRQGVWPLQAEEILYEHLVEDNTLPYNIRLTATMKTKP